MCVFRNLFYILSRRQMTNQIDLTQFNKTDIIKKLSKSKSEENLKIISEEKAEEETQTEPLHEKQKRGRKSKYNTPEERLEARRQQQKEYRLRKKKELEELKKLAELIKA